MGQQWERSLFCQFQLLGRYWKVHWLKLAPGLKKVQWGKPTPPNIFFRPILPNFEKKLKSETMILGGGPCSQSVRQVLLYFWSVMLIEEVITTIAQNDHQPPPMSQLDDRPHKITCTSSFLQIQRNTFSFKVFYHCTCGCIPSNCTYCYYAVSSQSYPNGQVEYDKQGW